MTSLSLTKITFLVLILGCARLSAAENPFSFQQGVDAARSGDPAAALHYFLQAQAEGMDSGRLYYNIGVSHYQLGDYEAADLAFRKAADDPELSGLAYYNLALVAIARHDTDAARDWVRRSLAVNDQPQLEQLATELQARLEPATRTRGGQGIALLNIQGGYNDNVTLRDESQLLTPSNQDDYSLDVFAFGQLPLPDSGPYHRTVDAGFYAQRYTDLKSYELTMLQLGGVMSYPLPEWKLDTGLHAAFFQLGGEPLYRTGTLKLEARRKSAQQLSLSLFGELSAIDASHTNYHYLGGWRYRAGVKAVLKKSGPQQDTLEYVIEDNDRNDSRNASSFISYSPLRQSLSGSISRPISPGLVARLTLDGRYSHYHDTNIPLVGAPIRRKELRQRMLARLTYSLKDNIDLQADYRYTRNHSNLALYDYHSNEVNLGVSVTW